MIVARFQATMKRTSGHSVKINTNHKVKAQPKQRSHLDLSALGVFVFLECIREEFLRMRV